jgi:hypothetical protein
MTLLGQIDEQELAPFFQPLQNLITKVTTLVILFYLTGAQINNMPQSKDS